MDEVELPKALRVVAVLFIIAGVCAAIDTLINLTHSTFKLNFAMLGFFIGPGLLRLSRGWRTCGLVLLWLGLIFGLVGLAFVVMTNAPVNVDLFGLSLGPAPKPIGLLAMLAGFALALWEYRVLTRPDVRTLFGLA